MNDSIFDPNDGATWLGKEPPEVEQLRRKRKTERDDNLAAHLTVNDDPWDEDCLNARPWLAPPYMMRGQITLLHGPGAAGKSMLIIVWAVALVLGMAFGRLKPKGRCRVLLTNFEDDDEEQKKRISAALRFFGNKPADLKGRLYRVSLGPNADPTMFQLDHNGVHATDCWHALEYACETIRPDAVALDPFVAINAVPENENQLMRRVMTMMRTGCAVQFHCAVLLAHHDNKLATGDEDNDQNSARGGGDIVNAARFELAVRKMTAAQAKGWGVETDRRGFLFRVGSAASKRNYTAPEDSEWFERQEILIGEESVVYCIPWETPNDKLDDAFATRLVTIIGNGTAAGPYSPQIGNSNRSLGPALEALGFKTKVAQRRVIADLKRHHGIQEMPWKVPGMGERIRQGLRTACGRPGNYEWQNPDGEGADG